MCEVQKMPLDGCAVDQTQKAEKYIGIYIDNLVGKFRHYNNDVFVVTILGLKDFVDTDNKVLEFLFQQLKDCNFEIKIDGSQKNVDVVEVECKNISKNENYNYKYQIQNLTSFIELSGRTGIPFVGIIIMRIVAQTIIKQKILYKTIVLDLDGTLWKGTLAEDGIAKIMQNQKTDQGAQFVGFMNFIKLLAKELGIFVAVCTRNDSKIVETAFEIIDENIFPLKNQIDCLIANYNDKSDNIKDIAKRLSILPESIVFVDDNQIIRDEVRKKLPEVFVPEWYEISDLITQLVAGCIFERNELSINSQERRKQFEILQAERKKNDLPRLLIKVLKDNNHAEASRLYAKSNQFKLTNFNHNFNDRSESIYFKIYRQNGEDLGICSAITYCVLDSGSIVILNWAISCRYFEIGLEEFILLYMLENHKNGRLDLICQTTGMNNKVDDLIDKYYGVAFMDDCSSIPNDSREFIKYLPNDDEHYKCLLTETTNAIGGFALYSILSGEETLKENTNLKAI
ncbi:MAG: HAD-IIIC family phosphatase [Bacteroidales bacterium]|nr:HAD-IIIC family phosphatase [Bacteroidales bacterium]